MLAMAACVNKPIASPAFILEPEPELEESPSIIGFVNTNPTNDPWPQVGVLLDEHMLASCSATLVAPNIILTAHHCVIDEHDYYFELLDGRLYKIEEVIIYSENTSDTIFSDCALLILEESIYDIEPLNIASENFMTKGYPLEVVGYGGGWKKHSEPGEFWYYGILVGEELYFKTLPYESTIWFGDSGGPAIAVLNGNTYIVGVIASFTFSNNIVIENSFSRVDIMYDWLDSIITARSVCEED
jgi:hypothetical protein